jgi:hypothetical protein
MAVGIETHPNYWTGNEQQIIATSDTKSIEEDSINSLSELHLMRRLRGL